MVEPITTLGLVGLAAYLGQDSVQKLLGPTADYFGGELKELAQQRFQNIFKILRNAELKLGDKINENGTVPPKVLKTIINEGSYSDDQISVEYYGGILASSRSDNLRDDRGIRIAKTIDNLSCYQLRTHYLIYSTVSTIFKNTDKRLNTNDDREKLRIFIPYDEYLKAMDLNGNEINNQQIIPHIFTGLSSDQLVGSDWSIGQPESLNDRFSIRSITKPGIVCKPSITGTELFIWGFGLGNKNLEYIFSSEFNSIVDGIDVFINGSCQI